MADWLGSPFVWWYVSWTPYHYGVLVKIGLSHDCSSSPVNAVGVQETGGMQHSRVKVQRMWALHPIDKLGSWAFSTRRYKKCLNQLGHKIAWENGWWHGDANQQKESKRWFHWPGVQTQLMHTDADSFYWGFWTTAEKCLGSKCSLLKLRGFSRIYTGFIQTLLDLDGI